MPADLVVGCVAAHEDGNLQDDLGASVHSSIQTPDQECGLSHQPLPAARDAELYQDSSSDHYLISTVNRVESNNIVTLRVAEPSLPPTSPIQAIFIDDHNCGGLVIAATHSKSGEGQIALSLHTPC